MLSQSITVIVLYKYIPPYYYSLIKLFLIFNCPRIKLLLFNNAYFI